MYVIRIWESGATCSGKTTLAKHLRSILPGSVILHQDVSGLSHPSYLSPTNTKLPCRVHFVLHRSRRKLGFRTGVFDASHLLVITWKLKLGFDFLTWRPATSHFKSHKNWSRSEKNMAYKTGIVLKEQLIGRRWSTLYDRYRTSSIVSIIFQPHIDISPR